MLINNKSLIKTIKRIDLTTEQETNLNEMPEIKKNISDIKSVIGDSNSGLIKDVKNLKENVVSQDSINMAVNNYLTEHPVTSGATAEQAAQIEANKTAIKNIMPLDFSNTDVVESIQNTVDETIIKQEYLGGYIEIQPDSWDSVSCSTDDSTNIWGFPTSLSNSEQEVIKNDTLAGNGKGIMYIRFPLGFAYRGYRNIDETTRLAKNIGERFKGQNARLKSLFENISRAGGGLAPEYWCPPPYWVTGGAYYNADVPNFISAGGSYSQDTKLSSIITSDPTQYAAQIDAFTDAIIDDLEYLHQNIAPVRMFGLQNEPGYSSQKYGACSYDTQTYCDVLASLYPKIQSSPILSVYNDEPNEVKLHVGSDDSANPWTGITATYIQQHRESIWGYSHHSMRKASGEVEYETGKRGADWYKSEDFSTIKYIRDNVFINEYEYFGTFAGDTDEFRCSNNMLRMINEFVYGGAKIIHPVIHLCKPLGQTAAATNTKGYCLYAVNLKGEYGKELTDSTNTDRIPKGSFTKNPTMYNSWAIIKNNLPIGAYLIGDYTNTADNIGYCAFKYHGKVYVFLANNGADKKSIILTFDNEKLFSGKYYDLNNIDLPLAEKQGTTIEFVLPPYSGQCWIEKDNLGVEYESKEPVLLTRLSATYNQGNTIVYPNTSLNSLKNNLVVTGTYSDGTTKTITNYTLSGTLTVGTSTVTISYNGLTTTFDVTVTSKPPITNTLTTDSLISNIQAEDGCMVQEGSKVKIIDKFDNSKIESDTLTLDMYNSANKAISFASTNKLTIEKKPTARTDFSLEAMIKTNTLIKTTTKMAIINFDSGTNKDGVGFICRTGNILEASYRTSANETTAIQHVLNTDTTWTHMVAVVDISNMKLSFYVNGELVDTKDISTVYATTKPISINTVAPFDSNYDINMIRLYDKALLKEEVISNYNYQQTLVSEKPTPILSSIKATYTQGDIVVYPNTSLDSLKNNLVVTGTYSDSSIATITDYTLSGTLTEGTSTITVSYNGKTTTFTVTVSASEEIRLLVEQGGINYATGVEEDSATKCRTDFIPVSGSTTTVRVWDFGHVVRCYDTSKNFIGTIQGEVAMTETTWTLLSNSAYIRLILNNAVIDEVSGRSAIVDGQTYRFHK